MKGEVNSWKANKSFRKDNICTVRDFQRQLNLYTNEVSCDFQHLTSVNWLLKTNKTWYLYAIYGGIHKKYS